MIVGGDVPLGVELEAQTLAVRRDAERVGRGQVIVLVVPVVAADLKAVRCAVRRAVEVPERVPAEVACLPVRPTAAVDRIREVGIERCRDRLGAWLSWPGLRARQNPSSHVAGAGGTEQTKHADDAKAGISCAHCLPLWACCKSVVREILPSGRSAAFRPTEEW